MYGERVYDFIEPTENGPTERISRILPSSRVKLKPIGGIQTGHGITYVNEEGQIAWHGPRWRIRTQTRADELGKNNEADKS